MGHRKRERREPATPPPESETARRSILALLEGGPCTAAEISAAVGRPEKDVLEHLAHLRKSLRRGDLRLEISPAACRTCGFVFRKRDRVTSPGRCPICKGESISDPAFRVE